MPNVGQRTPRPSSLGCNRRRAWLAQAALLLILNAPLAARAAVLSPMDLFKLSEGTEPQIRPQGDVVAYVRVTNDIMTDEGRTSIWLVDTRTGAQSPLKGLESIRLTRVPKEAADATAVQPSLAAPGLIKTSQPRWSPSGDRLAFVAQLNGKTLGLYVYQLDSARVARVATLARPASALSWSRDGEHIAFIMHDSASPETLGKPLDKPSGANWADPLNVTTRVIYHKDGQGDLEPGNDHVFVVAAGGGTQRRLTQGAFDDAGPISWAPDGASLVITSRRGADWERQGLRSAIYRISLSDGASVRLSPGLGPDASASVSPDGKSIAFSGYDDSQRRRFENRRIYVVASEGGVPRAVDHLDRSLDHPQWSADGRSLYALYDDRGTTKVAQLDLKGGVRDMAEGLADSGLDLPYTGGDFTVAQDGTIAFPQGASDHPPDIAITRGGRTQRLTFLNDALLSDIKLGRVTPLAFLASERLPVDAWLVTPPNFDPRQRWPMILEIHGGPFLDYGPHFATDMQLYAAAGYVVLYVNPHGSTSYGEAFANGVDRNLSGADYDDLMAAVDAAITKGFINPSRLFVTGGSWGGLMTAWIVGQTHRFRAAAAQRAVINWTSLVVTSDSGFKTITNWFGKTPWADPVGYWSLSPLSLVGNVTTPTLVVAGDKDVRTPLSEGEQFYGALQFRGVPTGLVRVPGAFHDLAERPSHAAEKARAILAWFARYDHAPN